MRQIPMWAIPTTVAVVGGILIILIGSKMKDGTYFTFSELTHSDTASAKGIDNTPNSSQTKNIMKLIGLLDRIRARFGRAIRVTSGFRSEALNKVVGGVSGSQHLTGQAADIVPASGGTLADIFRSAVQVGGFDQLIIEQSGSSRWIHVSWSSTPRGQVLAYNNGTYRNITNNWQAYV